MAAMQAAAAVTGRTLARHSATIAARSSSSRRQPLRVTARAAGSAPPFTPGSGSSSSTRGGNGGGFGAATSPPPMDAAALSKRLQELQELLREAAQIAIATGPRSITRSAQAASALLSVAREQAVLLQAGQPPEGPAIVLRKLFERLGATYIKLGQFIASRCSEPGPWEAGRGRALRDAAGCLGRGLPNRCPTNRACCTPALPVVCHPCCSPTLFPEEYVLEFQKCLDSTEPVPFEVIRWGAGGGTRRPAARHSISPQTICPTAPRSLLLPARCTGAPHARSLPPPQLIDAKPRRCRRRWAQAHGRV